MPSRLFPDDLLRRQRALDEAESAWRRAVLHLYAHEVMQRARAEGRLEETVVALREAARAA